MHLFQRMEDNIQFHNQPLSKRIFGFNNLRPMGGANAQKNESRQEVYLQEVLPLRPCRL